MKIIKEYGLFFTLKNKKKMICYSILGNKKSIIQSYELMKKLGLYPEVSNWFISKREVKYSEWDKKKLLK